jgi:hypothetical protein
MDIRSENLAYWYLRLNGFLTTVNFVVHPDQGDRQETDVDVLGVRFPYRAENLQRPMRDDELFSRVRDRLFVVIAEVKSGRCALNGPWTKPERRNMLRVVSAIGAFAKEEAELVADALHKYGHYQSQPYHVSLMCFGREANPEITERYSHVPQILWPEALGFVFRRFHEYNREKISHSQWDSSGRALWEAFEQSRDENRFVNCVRVL